MNVDVVGDVEGLRALGQEWDALHERAGAPFYVGHPVVTAWWEAYRHDPAHELAVVTARQGDQLVGIAPLAVTSQTVRGRPRRVVRWASHGDYLTFLVDPEARATTVCRALVDHVRHGLRRDSVNLPQIPADSPLAAYLLRSPELNPQLQFLVENPYVDLTRYETGEDFRRAQLSPDVRKKHNRYLRQVEPQLHVYAGDEGGVFDRMAELHQVEKQYLVQQRDRRERHSLFENDQRVAMYRPLYEAGATLTFTHESSDGELLAYQTCFVQGRRLLGWNGAYSPTVADASPSTWLLVDVIRHLIDDEDDYDTFDLGSGRYPWKFGLTDSFTATYRWMVKAETPAEPPAPAPTVTPPTATTTSARTPEPSGRTGAISSARRVVRRGARRALAAARRPFAAPVVWYVPHPDDETIFMGGSIARTRDRRNLLVVLTRGGSSTAIGKVSRRLGRELRPEEFTAGRQAELRAAVSALGVREQDLVQHDLPDGAVTVDAVHAIITEMARQHPRAAHRSLSYVDPHPDHRAAGQALRRAYDEGLVQDVLFFMPVPIMTARQFRRAPLGVADVAAKRRALEEYRRWAPEEGRFAIGATSVASVVDKQLADPVERVHGPEHPLPRRART